jgi:hypothetical protein
MKNKLSKYLIISLLTLNVICIYFLIRPHRGPHHPPKITNIIHFDEATKLKIDKMENTHFKQMSTYSNKIKIIREKIYLNNKNGIDKLDYVSLFDEMSENQKNIEKLRFQYFSDIKKLCNKKQQIELDLFVKRMLEHEAMRKPKGK